MGRVLVLVLQPQAWSPSVPTVSKHIPQRHLALDHSLRCTSWGLGCLFLPCSENLPLICMCWWELHGAEWEMLMFPLGIHFVSQKKYI